MDAGLIRYSADLVVEVTADAVLTHPGGTVDVSGGRIVAIGPAPSDDDGHQVVALGGLVMPGLVNAHSHAAMTLLRSAGDGLPLDRWLSEAIWPREAKLTPDDVRAGMVLGSLEMLLAGVTTSVEMYLHDEAIIDAVQQTGGRLVSTPGVIRVLHGNDMTGRLEEIRDLHARYHRPDQRISVGFGPHSTYDLDAPLVRLVVEAASELDTVLHIHLEETEEERELVLARDGVSATQLLADAGALECCFVGAHGVWLDDHDRRVLGSAGASLAHCPNSNLKLGSGFADVRAMIDAGVNVAIGTDGPGSADSLDLWRGVSLAAGLARGLRHDPQALSVHETLLMATARGGQAIGQPDVGTLTVGSRADFIRIDIDQSVFTPALDDLELLTHLVFANQGGFVTDVWVDGEQVVAHRQPLRADLGEAMRDVAQRSSSGRG